MAEDHKSLREQILKSCDLPKKSIDVPEWGCSVYVRSLTANQRDSWETALQNGNLHARARLVAYGLCDKDGNRIFADDDLAKLGEKNGEVLTRLVEEISKVNALTKKDLDDLEKKSEPAPVA